MKVALNVNSNANQCGACKRLFRSVSGHEKHRTGRFGLDRRCMSDEELLEAGMIQNDRGQWVLHDPEGADRMAQYFADADEPEELDHRD